MVDKSNVYWHTSFSPEAFRIPGNEKKKWQFTLKLPAITTIKAEHASRSKNIISVQG